MNHGSCRFGLWRVAVDFNGDVVYRVSFQKTAPEGVVPVQFTRFLAGKSFDFEPLKSAALADGELYYKIYRAVSEIPYGETRTYAEIAETAGTHARVVGNAMARNPTPLIVPCHRVVSKDGLGGFTPDLEIKKELLAMENKNKR
ncbi:MAG: methylated-DNA--[protein]-cysteine S-methyltransferase [Methanocorpusculum sp.]|nr:methylated-DNA--[protein]-cysteine S-methyltransferase [Methanocorpusculum sp.]